MERIGIRELRMNLRTYLRRAAAGSAFEVTEFGHPIARLGPLPTTSSRIARLVAEGRITSARRPAAGLPPPAVAGSGQSATAALLAERDQDAR